MRRSNQASRRYWALVNRAAEILKPQGHVYSAEAWHTWFKQRFLGAEDLVLPNGKTIVIPHSSASLDVAEFSEYMTAVEAWCNERDVYLEDEVFA